MKIIISPAKKMNSEEFIPWQQLPVFLKKTQQLLEYLQQCDYDTCKKIWKCNDSIAELNQNRLQHCNLKQNLSPALFCYEGLQYQSLAPQALTSEQLNYLSDHLRILSGFYGILQPLDGIVPYRLEMQAKLPDFSVKDLYTFWRNTLAEHLCSETDCIVNLASKEYSKAVQKHLSTGIQWIDCTFARIVNGKLMEQATFAKMARGAMVRFLAENNAQTPDIMKSFSGFGFCYSQQYSSQNHLFFIQ